jgi:hypothetical protein
MVTVLVLVSEPSDAVSCSTYVPAVEKQAVVLKALTLPKVTVLGPLDIDHVVVRASPEGSLAVPLNVAHDGRVTV